MLLHFNNSTVYGHAIALQQLSCTWSCCCISATLLYKVMVLHFSNSTAHGHAVALQQLYCTCSCCCTSITVLYKVRLLHFSNSTVHGHSVALHQLYCTRSGCCTSVTLLYTVMLLHFTNSLSFHSLLQGMLLAQGGSHRQAHLWEPQIEAQYQFSHLVSLPATKNRCDDTNMTFSNTTKH